MTRLREIRTDEVSEVTYLIPSLFILFHLYFLFCFSVFSFDVRDSFPFQIPTPFTWRPTSFVFGDLPLQLRPFKRDHCFPCWVLTYPVQCVLGQDYLESVLTLRGQSKPYSVGSTDCIYSRCRRIISVYHSHSVINNLIPTNSNNRR